MNIKNLSKKVESVSKVYASEFNIERDSNWYVLKLQEEVGELVHSYLRLIGKSNRKGKTNKELQKEFADEVADVFCHVLLISEKHKIDLEKVVEKKWFSFLKKKGV